MFKYSQQLLKWATLLHSNIYRCYIPHLSINHQAELTIKATRRQFLNKAVLNQNKQVIYAEPRKTTDFVMKLWREGKCPGVIIPISKKKEEEVDIVLQGKPMKTKIKRPQYGLEKVHVRVQGKEYCCVLREVRMNPIKHFIQKVYLQEYVPGEPNNIIVPLRFIRMEDNRFFHQGFQYEFGSDNVSIICYNHEYPARFYIDVSYVNPDRPYTLGDLANTFPPGVLLHPSVDPAKVVFYVKEPETQSLLDSGQSLKDIMTTLNLGKPEKKAPAQTSTPAAGEKGTPAAGGKGAPAAGGKGASAATSADSGKKK